MLGFFKFQDTNQKLLVLFENIFFNKAKIVQTTKNIGFFPLSLNIKIIRRIHI